MKKKLVDRVMRDFGSPIWRNVSLDIDDDLTVAPTADAEAAVYGPDATPPMFATIMRVR